MKYLELPTSVSDVRSSLQELERGCPRSDMLELLKISSNPSLSTLDDPDSFLLIESWQLEPSYKLTILYDRVDENIFFVKGLLKTQLAGPRQSAKTMRESFLNIQSQTGSDQGCQRARSES